MKSKRQTAQELIKSKTAFNFKSKSVSAKGHAIPSDPTGTTVFTIPTMTVSKTCQ